MRLNEYIFNRIIEIQNKRPEDRACLWPAGIYFTKNEIEEWIVTWYRNSFQDPHGNPNMPPSWLANWRLRIRPIQEQEACGIDEN